MRKLLLAASLLALTSAGALAQAPQGVVPTAAVPQRTEPGRYWVFFAWNRADLPPDGRKVVDEAAQSFLRTGSARISLVGSADRTGSSAYNEQLSARRAEAVRAELERLGVPAGAIAVRAAGENAPIVANAQGVREPLNRYVAIDFPDREAAPAPSAAPEAAPVMPPAAPEEAKAAAWQLSVTPYLWAVALKGDVGVGRTSADVDASFNDILDNLNGALMLSLELRKGRFGLLSDTVYANLEDNAATGDDRLKIDATANMLIQSLAGTYRAGTWQLADFGTTGPLAVTVDPYAGVRYTYLDLELDGKLDLPDFGIATRRTAEKDKQWADPIVGVRTAWTLGERWSLVLAGDVGGISTSDQYSAEAWSTIGYRFGLFGSNNATALAGYRVLKQKYEDGDGRSRFDWDMTIHGPILGLKITFFLTYGECDMNVTSYLPRILSVMALAGLIALAGCTHQQTENPALSEYPGIQLRIESYYNANATEDDWTCNEVQMDNIDKSQVVSQSPTQVRVAATYYFTSLDESPGQGGDQCQGFNTRFFTFAKSPGGQLSLVSMSGPQRGVSG